MPTVVKEPEPQGHPVVAAVSQTITATPRTNQELLALYRARKAEKRPRDRGRKFHLQNEELRDRLETKPNRSEAKTPGVIC